MGPLIIKPIYLEKPWGNSLLLYKFKEMYTDSNVGEVIEFVLDENNKSNILNKDINMDTILKDKKLCKRIFGKSFFLYKNFPILIKTLFINGEISLQVHPDNRYARKHEKSFGKNEMWYVLYADENTYAKIGLKCKLNKNALKKIIDEEDITKYLKVVKIKSGDIINIPAGTIHSVTGKAILYEVQQNSNITYRIKDNNNRNLHIEKAIAAFKNNYINVKHKEVGTLIKNNFFKVKKVNIYGKKKIKTFNKCTIITVANGMGKIISASNIEIRKGMTLLIPAYINSYSIEGNLELLLTSY